ncbi:hypothetical protein LMG28140_04484 [Paraburkholderia metrosideri]|uniref:Flagellin n=1 Tax=Paraburkholderia metrosideri TaxID=580937 RepID=A0ABN7I425_9BURK|nr:hypothetical protein LMG28140_04484 [Paraburkholderia metrosideri]
MRDITLTQANANSTTGAATAADTTQTAFANA